jgi:hypothetical protein
VAPGQVPLGEAEGTQDCDGFAQRHLLVGQVPIGLRWGSPIGSFTLTGVHESIVPAAAVARMVPHQRGFRLMAC